MTDLLHTIELLNSIVSPVDVEVVQSMLVTGYYNWNCSSKKPVKNLRKVFNTLRKFTKLDITVKETVSVDMRTKILTLCHQDKDIISFYKEKGKHIKSGIITILDPVLLAEVTAAIIDTLAYRCTGKI